MRAQGSGVRASDRAYESLRQEILEWRLLPGAVLAEVEQAARLGVSRTPLREALARLSADGLVETQLGRGLIVSATSVETARELFEVREALEGKEASLAAARRDPAVFEQLRIEFADAASLLREPSRHAYYDLVRRFDDAVDEAAGNAYLSTALRSLRAHLVRIRRVAHDDTPRLVAAAGEHLLIVEAILAGNPELARQATSVHLYRSLRNILASADARLLSSADILERTP